MSPTVDDGYVRAYTEHWVDTYRFALAWTNDRAAAEDLAQEAFVRLWRARGRIDWTRPLLGWLLVTTRRLATDRARAIRRRLMTYLAGSTYDEDARDRWIDVRAEMARLSSVERAAIVLTALAGYTYDDTANVLGTSPGAVRAAVSRARSKLEER